jgi:hypothetical protein
VAVMKELLIGQDEQPRNNPQDCTTGQAFFICPDGSTVDALYVSDNGRPRLVTAAELCKPTIEALVRSVHPDVRVNVTFSVHRSWLDFLSNHTRTLPQAEEIAAAIIAEYGGSVAVTPLPESTACDGAVKVTLASGDLGTTDVDIFYGKGVPPCSAS